MDKNRNEQRRQWWLKHPELKVNPSMKRRKANHDYYGRCIYMLTLVAEGRKPLLGELRPADHSHDKPWVSPSPLGEHIIQCWHDIPKFCSQIRIIGLQLMPDHLHGVLFVTDRLDKHLGHYINGFKKSCNDVVREMHGSVPLWEEGYHDRILRGKNHLKKMERYMNENPMHLWTRRMHPEFFTVQHSVNIQGQVVATVGNRFLLDYPMKVAVQCSRSLNAQEIIDTVNRHLTMISNGALLVSACISPGEKAVMRAAFNAGAKAIIVMENGFSPLWKPGGAQFNACAAGQLLLVAPWPHHGDRRTITREQCLQLNDLVRRIAGQE